MTRRRAWVLGIAGVIVGLALTWAIIAKIMPAWYARLWYPLNNIPVLQAAAHREQLDPSLIAAVIQVESKWDPSAVSHAGAVGLMQLEPSTAQFIARQRGAPPGDPSDLRDSDVNINYGSWYLRYLINRTGTVPSALVAYNAGERNLAVWRARAAASGHPFTVPNDVPFPETKAFLQNVLNDAGIYRRAYSGDLQPRIPGYAVVASAG